MSSVWKPISRNNCEEPQYQRWQSTTAGNRAEEPEKMTSRALQRAFLKDESLLKFTDELLKLRENLAASLKKDVNKEIYKLNKRCSEEIKVLTSRLLEFLRDIKVNIEKSKCYDDIIPHWKTCWDTNIDQWSCDVRSLLASLRENVILSLKKAESKFIDSKKFTPTQVDGFLNDQVIKLNHLMIVNEKMYTDTERHLKLMFDTLLQGWLISYSYQEIVTKECDEPIIKAPELTVEETNPVQETVKMMEKILNGLDEEELEFFNVTALKIYLNYLRMCQQHVKLHLKEALGYLKNHLEKRKVYVMDDANRSQLEALWMEIVTILKEQNDEFKHYSKQSAFAWNQFVKRLHCAENTAVRSIAKLRTTKLTKTLTAEQHMNSLLDHLRESSSIRNMEHIFDRILIELENAELACVSVRDEEDGIIKQFITAIFAANDILSLQLSMLNDSYPNLGTDVFCVELNSDETKEISDLEFIRMKYCVFSAQTWIQGLNILQMRKVNKRYDFRLKETWTLLEAELPKFLKMFLVNLIDVYKGESEYWLMLQLEKLSKRKLRIRENVLEIRASELNAHNSAQKNIYQVIEQHQKRAKADIKKIKSDLSSSDAAVIEYLEKTKTNKLEDTAEKKLKNLADESLLEKHELVRQQTIKKSKYEMERIFKWLADYCTTYLHSLRLFHEGGNYCSEECDSAFKKIIKIIKSLESNSDKNLKKLDHVVSTTREAFKKRLSKIVYPDPTADELMKAAEREAKGRLEVCFNRLKEMIKNETYKALINLKSLKERIDEATRINDFTNWHQAISDIEQTCSYFGLSPTFPNIELLTVLQEAREYNLNSSFSQILSSASLARSMSRRFTLGSNKSRKRRKSGIKKIHQTASRMALSVINAITEDLFQFKENFENYDNYLTNTKTLIHETHSKVKPILADAYSKYNVPISHCESQRAEAVFNLKHYNLQCESVWTYLFEDYLNIFSSVYANTMSYVELIKKRHMYDSISNAIKLKATHKADLTKLNVEGVKEAIDNKLKPWHGYPLNKPLLQRLLRDVVDHCKAQLTSRKEVNETYRDALKVLVAENKLKAVDVVEDAKFLYVELFTNAALNSFLGDIWNYCESKNLEVTNIELTQLKQAISSFCLKFGNRRTLNPSRPDNYDYITFPFLDGYQFLNFVKHMKEILKILKDIQEKAGHIPYSLHARHMKSYEHELKTTEGEILEEEEEEISPHWKKLKEEMNTHVKEFENTAINNLIFAKKDFDRVAWDLTRWKNEWISNIKEVNRLYLINPILDHPPHKVASDPAAALKPDTAEDKI